MSALYRASASRNSGALAAPFAESCARTTPALTISAQTTSEIPPKIELCPILVTITRIDSPIHKRIV
jgi:hypothetical protein